MSLSAAACQGSGSSSSDDKPSSSPSPSSASTAASSPAASPSTGEKDQVKQKILKAYEGYWTEQVKAYSEGTTKGTKLEGYASGAALVQAQEGVAQVTKDGYRYRGKPRHDASVTEVTPARNGRLAMATIRDCLDISRWHSVNRKTGKVSPLPKGQPEQFIVTVTVEDWGEKGEAGWVVLKDEPSAREC
ncbi:hypothetical protein E0L36_04375 [Streptomyces sp. AJS327]|uniref:hypothetical protein n=1 Tax=Streptomyces sp. AJS327 TaxID=2545265 RepID=UPI0015DE0CA2|nr:hypothetical protein [Streptomyces sp. AJS327]MBA0050160.1 hypothetical protein [Streptomyces sp. AJS327]